MSNHSSNARAGHLDIAESATIPGADGARPFLMVTFHCRSGTAYQRVYRSVDGTHYMARCPKCGKSVRFVVGAGGTSSRAFAVECG